MNVSMDCCVLVVEAVCAPMTCQVLSELVLMRVSALPVRVMDVLVYIFLFLS